MRRRQFLKSAALSGTIGPLTLNTSVARQVATPGATPVGEGDQTLAERVAQVDPPLLLDALLSTPVTTPLFPSDTAPIEPVAWDDEGDTDLANTIGGVVFNTGYDENDNFISIGNVIVHPDTGSATARVNEMGPAQLDTFLNLPWFVQAVVGNAVSVVQVEYLLLVGGTIASSGGAAGSGTMTLRAISHTVALLDHLDSVLTDLRV